MFKRKVRVLFVCTGNSARSQMAHAWARHLGAGWLEADSAGVAPKGIHPCTVTVMREVGVDVSAHVSKPLTPELIAWADLVVTVCAHADAQCPVIPVGTQKRHWPVADPAMFAGDDARALPMFRAARDELRERVEGILGGLRLLAATRQDRA